MHECGYNSTNKNVKLKNAIFTKWQQKPQVLKLSLQLLANLSAHIDLFRFYKLSKI